MAGFTKLPKKLNGWPVKLTTTNEKRGTIKNTPKNMNTSHLATENPSN